MSIALVKSLGVKGCAVWKLDDEGVPGNNPNVDNVAVTLPSIELESTTINLMGSLDVPDISRIGNIQLTASVPLDVPAAMELAELGKVVSWIITWYSQEYNSVTGVTSPRSFTVYARGFITGIPNAEVNVGAENTGDITMNLIAYKKVDNTANEVKFEIDRGKSIFKINGEDILASTRELY